MEVRKACIYREGIMIQVPLVSLHSVYSAVTPCDVHLDIKEMVQIYRVLKLPELGALF